MTTISGRVVFDRDRSATINTGDSGISNIPGVLQKTATNVGLVVLTDANGNYRIVEDLGTLGRVPTPDPNPYDNSSPLETPVEELEADIAVEKENNEEVAVSGDTISYRIEVINFGPNMAEGVMLIDSIPSTILSPEYSIDGGATFHPWTGNLDLGILPATIIVTIIIRGTVSDTATGVIINTATVSSTTRDPNPDNNTSTVETSVEELESDIAIEKESN